MSVNYKPQKTAIFGASQGKTRHCYPAIFRVVGKTILALIIANEIRGLIIAAPVLYAMATNGMGLLVGFCSLAGVALSVIVPVYLWRKVS